MFVVLEQRVKCLCMRTIIRYSLDTVVRYCDFDMASFECEETRLGIRCTHRIVDVVFANCLFRYFLVGCACSLSPWFGTRILLQPRNNSESDLYSQIYRFDFGKK